MVRENNQRAKNEISENLSTAARHADVKRSRDEYEL